MNQGEQSMKFDEVYDFMSNGEHGTKLTKTELALYYIAQFYVEPKEFRYAGIDQIEPGIPIEYPAYSESIDFTRQDVMDYLINEGSKLTPYA
jgi:hypothetical protein